jgi:tetratricopeptide (TPR) repeat protein
VTELYSIKDAARIFGLQESRLRYWWQTGFITPSVRRQGRLFYTFPDLVSIKTAVELLDAGLTMQRVRKNLVALRAVLPEEPQPMARLRICSDGESVVAVEDDLVYEPATGQVVMAFAVATLSQQVAEILALPAPPAAVPTAADDGPTLAHERPTAYRCFLDGCEADDHGELARAEQCYRRALEIDPSLAAAHTNLGTLRYQRGDLEGARAAFEQALDYEPNQPEARFNLGNLLDDLGETEHAIAELRRVCTLSPDFADAHYNLGLILARVGGVAQAQQHLGRYLEIDPDSEWAARSRAFLAAL